MSENTATGPGQSTQKLTLVTMTAMVVGSMVGAGVFSLPRRFAQETGVLGAVIAWLIAGTGMLMLAFVFQMLAVRKPDLDAGVYAYAKAGFGEYLGFFSAFGYWASSLAYPLTLFPLAGLGILDATVLAGLVDTGGLALEPDIVAGLVLYRVITLLMPMVFGLAAIAWWRRTERERTHA